MSQHSNMFCLECINTTHASVGEIQEGGEKVIGRAAPEKTSDRKLIHYLKMQCLQVNISDRYTCATNIFYSVLFGPDHVGNRDTKAFIYSCIASHFTMRRTQAKSLYFVFCRLDTFCTTCFAGCKKYSSCQSPVRGDQSLAVLYGSFILLS